MGGLLSESSSFVVLLFFCFALAVVVEQSTNGAPTTDECGGDCGDW